MANKTFDTYGPVIQNTSKNLRTGVVSVLSPTIQFNRTTSSCVSSRPKPFPLTPTPLQIQRQIRNYTIYTRVTTTTELKGSVIHVHGGPNTALYRTFGEQDALATLNRALTKAAIGDVNVGTFIGEFASTKGMVVNRMKSIQNFFANAKNLNFHDIDKSHPGKMTQALKDKISKDPVHVRLSNNWLELQFGWLPLISDVWNSLDAFRTSLKTRGSTVKSTSRGKTANGRNSAGYIATVKNPALYSLTQLGLTNPLVVAWELVPFSFLIDYFINIGDTLKDVTSGLGVSNRMAWYVYEDVIVNYYTPSGAWYLRTVTVNRKVISNPSISLQFNEIRSSLTRASTTLALGFQRLR